MSSGVKRWVVATTNPGKVREIGEIVSPLGIELVHLGQLSTPTIEPVEDGPTFEANAAIKARSYAAQLGMRCLAEDSGLEVDALDGQPGVHSARYSGAAGPRQEVDALNNEKLVRELADVPAAERTARYVCAVCVAEPNGVIVAEARATFEGSIAAVAKGSGGFGYDPLFWVPEHGCTAAQLTPAQKNACSHRGKAVHLLCERL